MTIKDEIILSEHQEQRAFVEWLEMNNYKFSAIPNATYTKSFKQKQKNKLEGLRAGLPDLLVIVNDRLVFIEMKRCKKSLSTVSAKQAQWIKALNECKEVGAYVCYGCDHAIKTIEEIAKIAKEC